MPSHMQQHLFYGLRSQCRGWCSFIKGSLQRRLKKRDPRSTDSSVVGFWITDLWSDSYYHWMTDALQRLMWFKPFWNECPLYLPKVYQNLEVVTASLDVLGVKNVIYVNELIHLPSLWSSDLTAPSGVFREGCLRSLRSALSTQPRWHASRGPDRVYISRSRAHRRQLEHEDDLLKLLSRWRFTVVHLEDLPWREQAVLLKDCKLLMGNHGAGLSNMLFLPEDGVVWELGLERPKVVERGEVQLCFYSMASSLGLEYHHIATQRSQLKCSKHRSNVVVNLELLEEKLRHDLGDPEGA
jgi:capsular polysaccharide biosynthesis protein